MTTAARRLAPLLGLGGVVLLIVGNEVSNAGGGSPDLHASAVEYADAVGPDTGIAGVYLVVVGWLALAGFFRVLGERLRGTPDGARAARTVTGGGTLAAAVAVVAGLPQLATTLMA